MFKSSTLTGVKIVSVAHLPLKTSWSTLTVFTETSLKKKALLKDDWMIKTFTALLKLQLGPS